ncbi:hypothetical protein AB4Y63_10515 [Leifsonia sp. YAF41]|uniref:hypothetical protein n=1 Tax=Leifsonia sp. YAF41 TaxID=3233086 RepID=UPI003F9A2082
MYKHFQLAKTSLSERGSALIAVIGVMAVLALMAVTLSAVSISALAHTTSSRAGTQSNAAAESGVNFGRAQIARGVNPCSINWALAPTTTSFTATVQQSADGITWASCPALATTKLVRIVAQGTATSKGVAGVSARDTSKVSAIFDYVPGIGPVTPSGPGIFSYNTFGVDKGVLGVDAITLTGGGAIVRNGNFDCTNPNGKVAGSIWVYGDLDLGKCEVTGNAWVSGKATMQSSSNVAGTVCSSSGVTKNCPAGWTMPLSPDWVDIPFDPSKWVHTDGLPYVVVNVPAGQCDIDKVLDTANARSASGAALRPAIINSIDNCPDGIRVRGDMTIRRDVVVFARTFLLDQNKTTFTSPDVGRRIWFMTPDYVNDGVPSCPGNPIAGHSASAYPDGKEFVWGLGWDGSNNLSVEINGQLRAMLYSPCALKIKNNSIWNGQLYVGGTDAKNNFDFTYKQIGLGGANLNTGEEYTATTPSVTLKSIRDASAGG